MHHHLITMSGHYIDLIVDIRENWLLLKCCSKRYLCEEGRKRKSLLRWLCTTRGCSRLSSVTNGRKLAHALMETTVNSLTALGSFAQWSATHATKLRSAGWSLLALCARMVIDAISVMHLLNKRKLCHNLSPDQWSWKDEWSHGVVCLTQNVYNGT